MHQFKVLIQQKTSLDGIQKAVAQSVAIASGNAQTRISQSIEVKVLSNSSCSSSSTSSSASS